MNEQRIIAIVGMPDMDDDMKLGIHEYLLSILPHVHKVVLLSPDGGEDYIKQLCTNHAIPYKVVTPDRLFGVAATLKRNVQVAKDVEEVVVFWNYHHSVAMDMIAVARLYGKRIHVNPHEAGGIITPGIERSARSPMEETSASNPDSAGSNPAEPTSTS